LALSSPKRLVVAGAVAAVVALVIWSVVLLRDDNSVLSILIRMVGLGSRFEDQRRASYDVEVSEERSL
jgi:hypothetical protein